MRNNSRVKLYGVYSRGKYSLKGGGLVHNSRVKLGMNRLYQRFKLSGAKISLFFLCINLAGKVSLPKAYLVGQPRQ